MIAERTDLAGGPRDVSHALAALLSTTGNDLFRMTGGDAADLQFGGRMFEPASRLIRGVFYARASERVRVAARDPRGLSAAATVLLGLPRLQVSLTQGSAGRALRGHLDERQRGILLNRVAQGVLTLPPSFADYWSGRRRQAVRTNTHRARALGIESHRLGGADECRALLQRWPADWNPWPGWRVTIERWIDTPSTDAEWWLASDGEDRPLALALIKLDAEWAFLRALFSTSHPARWFLHTQLVASLCERGIRHMCVHNGFALLMSPQLQYFQRLLGYRVAHLSVDR